MEPTRRYEGAWFDNTRRRADAGRSAFDDASLMTFTLTSSTSDTDKQQFKVVERFTDDEHRIATTYKLRGGGSRKFSKSICSHDTVSGRHLRVND